MGVTVSAKDLQYEVDDPQGRNPYMVYDENGTVTGPADLAQDPEAVNTGLGAGGNADPDAPKNTAQAMDFLRRQHTSNSQQWGGLCLSLQRQARGLPGVYPSAIAAQHATPADERVEKLANLKRGMVLYFDDPNDSNEFGHIVGCAGWREGSDQSNLSDLLVWSNDARDAGGVDLVKASFFPGNWGDKFQFGATWLNGYDFSEFDQPARATRGGLGENYQHAMEDVRQAIERQRKAGKDRLVKLLKADLERMQNRWKAWKQ